MAKTITEAGRALLKSKSNLRHAHLISLEVPASGGVQVYFTTYDRDIVGPNGELYKAGVVKKAGTTRQTEELSNYNYSITISGLVDDEMGRLLNSTSYIGQTVKVFKVFLDPTTDTPLEVADDGYLVKLFEGQVISMGVKDRTSIKGAGSSDITWVCSSKLNNFNKVNGRLTDDASHRGLVSSGGTMQPSSSAKKIEYQTDKGFFHANQSLNVLAQYQTKEKRYKLKSSRASGISGFLGAKKYKTVEYWATVTREVDMEINLAAKYLPAVYGVRRVSSIPVFVDTDADDPSEIWAVYAFCEGEIEGFYDFYIDDNPIICVNDSDSAARTTCLGRKREAGNTINITGSGGGDQPATTDRQKYSYDDGNGAIDFWVFHGKTDQAAAEVLVEKAKAGTFKIQREKNMGPEYWDDTFKLCDTAYIVAKIKMTENRTSVPDFEAEILGKKIPVYNDAGSATSDHTSLNFAWQLLDYLTSPIYGAGLTLDQVDLDSFLKVAKLFDIIDTTYEGAWVPFWRYLGWKDRTNNNRQIMQGSAELDTSKEVFSILRDFLAQIDCAMNVTGGRQTLVAQAIKDPVTHIDFGEVMAGSFDLADTTSRDKFNSIQASITDPAKRWSTNPVTFYNSNFLSQDNNVENKGNFTFPYITNYYTARSRAERLLKMSRFSKEISIAVPYYFTGLAPLDIITFSHPRYSCDRKEFQVKSVMEDSAGKVTLKLKEFDPEALINSQQSDESTDQDPPPVVEVLPPRNLQYIPRLNTTVAGLQGELVWEPSLSSNVSYYSIARTGSVTTDTVLALDVNEGKYSFPVIGLTPGPYTFQVRAILLTGISSAPATIVAQVGSSTALPNVVNLRLVNPSSTDSKVFLGGDLKVEWDSIEGIDNLQYRVQVLNSGGTVLRSVIVTPNNYSYTLANNKSDYNTTVGSNGFNRTLTVRVKAVVADEAASVDWAVL